MPKRGRDGPHDRGGLRIDGHRQEQPLPGPGRALGWPVIHSDAVRKTLAGLKPTDRVPVDFGQGIYNEDFSTRTYDEMLRLAQSLPGGRARA